MNSSDIDFAVLDVTDNFDFASGIDVFVAAAGFEDRAAAFINKAKFSDEAICILTYFDNDIEENGDVERKFHETARKKFNKNNLHFPRLNLDRIDSFKAKIRDLVLDLPQKSTSVWIDISGFPSYAICAVIEEFRSCRPYEPINIIYTSALQYSPTFEQYQKIDEMDGFETSSLPQSMAMEMSKPLTFEPFSGRLSGESQSCLALFAGYEPHRSAGIIEAINPSMLLLIYGIPSDPSFSWRESLSRKLHGRFERTRRRAVEMVGTQDVAEALRILEEYYNFLIDDYNLIISPICSKMQVIASYLFWEKYQEVKLTFPLPIGYNPDFCPVGVANTYHLHIPSRVRFK